MPHDNAGCVKERLCLSSNVICIRVILDVLSSLSLCASYSEVMKFEGSAAASRTSEQKRRRLHSCHSVDVTVSSNIPIPSNKEAFLANERNKQSFINLLGNYL